MLQFLIGLSTLVSVGAQIGQGVAAQNALEENLKTARRDAAAQADAELVNMHIGLPGALNAATR